MIPKPAHDIVLDLLNKTRMGEARWRRTPFSGGRNIVLDLGGYEISVYEGRDDAIFFGLRTELGVHLFSFSVERDDADYETMSELLEKGHWQAVNLDGALNDVRRLVKQIGSFG